MYTRDRLAAENAVFLTEEHVGLFITRCKAADTSSMDGAYDFHLGPFYVDSGKNILIVQFLPLHWRMGGLSNRSYFVCSNFPFDVRTDITQLYLQYLNKMFGYKLQTVNI